MSMGIPRLVICGKLPRKNLQWEAANIHFEIIEDKYVLPIAYDPSAYLSLALQGATIVPRAAWFVRIPKPENKGIVDTKLPYVESDPTIGRKKPWDKIHFEGEVEAQFLFVTVLGSDIVPFALEKVRPVILPIEIGAKKNIELLDSKRALSRGFSFMAEWLRQVEKTWNTLKKKGSKLSIYERLNFHNLLVNQLPKAEHRIVFTAAGTHMTSARVSDSDFSAMVHNVQLGGFIVEHKFYSIATSCAEEAYYLVAILNSPAIDRVIKPYQTLGLMGERDIERRALEIVPIPTFDPSNSIHQTLVELGRRGEQEAFKTLPAVKELKTGDKRSAIRKALKDILREIDANVNKLVKLDKGKGPTMHKVVRGQTNLEFLE